jgi:hypothetical protein
MAEFIRKTESTYFGPWLIDKAALDELDEIIDDQVDRLTEHRKTEINAAVHREKNRIKRASACPASPGTGTSCRLG